MRKVFILLILIWSIASSAASDDEISKANSTALLWLSHLEAGQYDTTWQEAATGFRERNTLRQWHETIASSREPLGKLLNRTLRNSERITNPEGAPVGEYIQLQYISTSEKKHRAIETVTQTLEEGTWRVTGYYVYAVQACPEKLWKSDNKDFVLPLFQDPRSMQTHEQSKCLPATFTNVAIGSPLCLFDGQVRVRAANVKMFVEDKTLIEYQYLVAYSSKRHEKLLSILKDRYQLVPPSLYPERVKSIPLQEELTALFVTDNTYIALQKPTQHARGARHSVVRFTKEKFLDISRRDEKLCH